MKERELILKQLDRKIMLFKSLDELIVPPNGWVYSIRKALNMSLRQLGQRMGVTAQSVREMEGREKRATVSIGVLKQVAKALDMKFVYGFIPEAHSLEKMLEKRAFEIATEIVQRTSVNMDLEDQKTSDASIQQAIREKAAEIKSTTPRYLWE